MNAITNIVRGFYVPALILGMLGTIVGGYSASAQIPEHISYQGLVTSSGSGALVPDGTYDMTLGLYDVQSGGAALWTETQSVTVKRGLFKVVLGSSTPFSSAGLKFDKSYYLGVSINDGPELPRTELTAAPYSLRTSVADLAMTVPDNAITGAKIADGAVSTADLADAAVSVSKLADAAVTTTKIVDGAVTASKISTAGSGNGQVLTSNGATASWQSIANLGDITDVTAGPGLSGGGTSGNVTVQIANGGVVSAMIADGAVNTPKLGDRTVTRDKIAFGAIGPSQIENDAVDGPKILDRSIGAQDLGDGVVMTRSIQNGAVTGDKIGGMGAQAGQALRWDGSHWAPADVNAWDLNGNNITNGGTGSGGKFLGTTSGNTQPLVLATDGTERARLDKDGLLMVGTTTPDGGRINVATDASVAGAPRDGLRAKSSVVGGSSLIHGVSGTAISSSNPTPGVASGIGVSGLSISGFTGPSQTATIVGVIGTSYIPNPNASVTAVGVSGEASSTNYLPNVGMFGQASRSYFSNTGVLATSNATMAQVLGLIPISQGLNSGVLAYTPGTGSGDYSINAIGKVRLMLSGSTSSGAPSQLQLVGGTSGTTRYSGFAASASQTVDNIDYTLPSSLGTAPAGKLLRIASTSGSSPNMGAELEWADATSFGWGVNGNDIASGGTGAGEEFLGTTSGNTQPLVLATDGTERARLDKDGLLMVGTTTPDGGRINVATDASVAGAPRDGLRAKSSVVGGSNLIHGVSGTAISSSNPTPGVASGIGVSGLSISGFTGPSQTATIVGAIGTSYIPNLNASVTAVGVSGEASSTNYLPNVGMFGQASRSYFSNTGVLATSNATMAQVLGLIPISQGQNSGVLAYTPGTGSGDYSINAIGKVRLMLSGSTSSGAPSQLQLVGGTSGTTRYSGFAASASQTVDNISYTLPSSLGTAPAGKLLRISSTSGSSPNMGAELEWADATSFGWGVNGNDIASGGTGAGEEFLGTTSGNTQPLVLATDGTERARLDKDGLLMVGTTTPDGGRINVATDASVAGAPRDGLRAKSSVVGGSNLIHGVSGTAISSSNPTPGVASGIGVSGLSISGFTGPSQTATIVGVTGTSYIPNLNASVTAVGVSGEASSTNYLPNVGMFGQASRSYFSNTGVLATSNATTAQVLGLIPISQGQNSGMLAYTPGTGSGDYSINAIGKVRLMLSGSTSSGAPSQLQLVGGTSGATRYSGFAASASQTVDNISYTLPSSLGTAPANKVLAVVSTSGSSPNLSAQLGWVDAATLGSSSERAVASGNIGSVDELMILAGGNVALDAGGARNGQQVWIVNTTTSTVTVSGTALAGSVVTLNGGRAASFIYHTTTGVWYAAAN